MPRCLDLLDPRAADPAVCGAKAASLAEAAAAGLPVLPGVVVTVDESEVVVSAAFKALGSSSVAKARLAAMTVEPDAELMQELREQVAEFPGPLIARSSSPLEADGTWSGAFSSFHGVGLDDLPTAVRGCWGSAFSVGVLDRAHQKGIPPTGLGLAVLIQPELMPTIGGTARLRADGSVQVTSTRGPLHPLMQGHVEGEIVTVTEAGVNGMEKEYEVMEQVAQLLHRVVGTLGHHTIEWAAVDQHVHLLQSIESSPLPVVSEASPEAFPELRSDVAKRVGALTQHFAGNLAESLVLPWAVAAELPLPQPAVVQAESPLEAFAAARSLANGLTATVWQGTPRSAAAEAERVLRQLRGDSPATALQTLEGLSQPPPQTIGELFGYLEIVRDALRAIVSFDIEGSFWRLAPDDVFKALRDGSLSDEIRLGVDRWEPYLHAVVSAVGESYTGVAAAPGAGAGRIHIVTDALAQAAPRGRYVLVASDPDPNLSPLLWNAAGLVTRAGSPAAHLIEFAHSIGVPTVIGCALPKFGPTQSLPMMAVDGDRGMVSIASILNEGEQ